MLELDIPSLVEWLKCYSAGSSQFDDFELYGRPHKKLQIVLQARIFIEASLGELLLQLVFFHKNSRQEIALSALIGQVRVSNLRRVAFIFYWSTVRIT